MKVVLTHGYFLEEDPKEQEIMRPYPPLGILCISAYLEQQGYDNDIFDSTFASMPKFKAYVLEEQPDIIGIYTNLMTKLNVLKMVQWMRSEPALQHTKIVLGGPEVRNHIENFLKHGVDALVLGEGEATLLALAKVYEHESKPDLAAIDGIAFLKPDQTVQQNPERTKIRHVDELPFPNRNKINLQLYFDAWKGKHGQSAVSINTMRGCPYSCRWCSRAVYGTSYRRRSPKLVVDEIEQLQQQYDFDQVWFVDDVFTISHKWLQAFVDELKQRKVTVAYECITRADRMNEEVIHMLKESGCFRVWIGAESGSQKILNAMDRRVTVEQVRDMIQLSQKNGLQAGTFIMVGYPGETEEDIDETIHHLVSSSPDLYTITVAYPIKGTPLYEEVEADFISPLPWETSTDRDIDFKRTYSRKYYDYAVRHIYNRVALDKLQRQQKGLSIPVIKHGLKSVATRAGMLKERLLH